MIREDDIDIQEVFKQYRTRKAKEKARKQRFIQRRRKLGYSHISSLWVHLNPAKTKILKEALKNASEKQLLSTINFLEDKTIYNNDQEKKPSTKTLLENELIKYLKLKQDNKTTESLNDLSIRLMNMGICTKSKKNKRKIRFTTSSLSRMLKKIRDETNIHHQ